MNNPYFLSEHTLSLSRDTDEWEESAWADAYEEARVVAAELMSPNDADYEAMVDKYYSELCERL